MGWGWRSKYRTFSYSSDFEFIFFVLLQMHFSFMARRSSGKLHCPATTLIGFVILQLIWFYGNIFYIAAFPDVIEKMINSDFEFLVLACDGIWDVLTNQEVIDFIRVRIAQRMDPEIVSVHSWQNLILEPPHDKTNKMACVPSEDSDQPGHPPSLIRVLAVRVKKAWVLNYPLSAQRRLWSDWVDAQADLSLRWAHSHLVGFVMRRLICSEKYSKMPEKKMKTIDCPWISNINLFRQFHNKIYSGEEKAPFK